MIVGFLLFVVAIFYIMEAFRKQKNKLFVYYKKIKYCIENVIIKNNSSLTWNVFFIGIKITWWNKS